jgi:hypothetical protein
MADGVLVDLALGGVHVPGGGVGVGTAAWHARFAEASRRGAQVVDGGFEFFGGLVISCNRGANTTPIASMTTEGMDPAMTLTGAADTRRLKPTWRVY